MLRLLRLLSIVTTQLFRSRSNLLLENLALRQQLAVLKRRHPQLRVALSDRLFWVILRRFWSGWQQALVFVQPETVVRWHRTGFKAHGHGSHGIEVAQAVNESARSCANSFSAWLLRIKLRVLRAFTAS